MTKTARTIEGESEREKVAGWRLHVLVEAGYPVALAELTVRPEIPRHHLVRGSIEPQQLGDERFGVSEQRRARSHGWSIRVTTWSMRVPSLSVIRILTGR